MISLDNAALTNLPARVDGPDYVRGDVAVGIVHIGVGGFHRAHEAVYVDRLLAAQPDWGICGVGVRAEDIETNAALAAQDGLYTLTTVDPDCVERTRVVGSIVRLEHAHRDARRVLEVMADPGVRIVSLTITEGGYGVDDETGVFAPNDPAVQADMAGVGVPTSALGFIVDALKVRRERGIPPFAVLSCDNIQHNGDVARTAVVGLALARDPDAAPRIAADVAFPNSMVDRITPVPTPEQRQAIAASTTLDDAAPVRSESYLQWVLEDIFPGGRPDWTAAGVQLVPDVDPYERMKLRLLNASHQVMSYPALLLGHSWVHDAARDLDVHALLRAWMCEARATLRPVPGVDLDDYVETLMARFGSEAVRDTLARQVVSSSDRLPKFVLPVVREAGAGAGAEIGAFVLAAWSLWIEAQAAGAGELLVDPRREALVAASRRETAGDVGALLRIEEIFGTLSADEVLRDRYAQHRRAIAEAGVRAALASVLDAAHGR